MPWVHVTAHERSPLAVTSGAWPVFVAAISRHIRRTFARTIARCAHDMVRGPCHNIRVHDVAALTDRKRRVLRRNTVELTPECDTILVSRVVTQGRLAFVFQRLRFRHTVNLSPFAITCKVPAYDCFFFFRRVMARRLLFA